MYMYSYLQISFEQFDDVRVRLYRPDSMVRNGPAMLWIHGGGWVTRTVGNYDIYVISPLAIA